MIFHFSLVMFSVWYYHFIQNINAKSRYHASQSHKYLRPRADPSIKILGILPLIRDCFLAISRCCGAVSNLLLLWPCRRGFGTGPAVDWGSGYPGSCRGGCSRHCLQWLHVGPLAESSSSFSFPCSVLSYILLILFPFLESKLQPLLLSVFMRKWKYFASCSFISLTSLAVRKTGW